MGFTERVENDIKKRYWDGKSRYYNSIDNEGISIREAIEKHFHYGEVDREIEILIFDFNYFSDEFKYFFSSYKDENDKLKTMLIEWVE